MKNNESTYRQVNSVLVFVTLLAVTRQWRRVEKKDVIGFVIIGAVITFCSVPVVAVEGLAPVSPQAWLCVLYGGIVSLCLANILWICGIKKVGSHRASIFNNLPPVFALVAGILFLNEIPLPSQVLGVVMILAGLFVFNGMPFREEQVG